MAKSNDILIGALLMVGAYYLFFKKKKPIANISNKETEQEEASSGGGVGGGFGVPPVGVIKDGIATPTGSIINITVEKEEEEPKLETTPVDMSKVGGDKKLDSATLLSNLEAQKLKSNIPLPTTDMGATKTSTVTSKTTMVKPKLSTTKTSSSSSLDLNKMGIKPMVMSNFLDFDGDTLDENELLID